MALPSQTPSATPAVAGKPAAVAATPLAKLTREQVELEQLVERYLNDGLTPRQKMELEAFCRENPKYIDEIRLSARMHAGLNLIESAGRPEPWNENPPRFWQTHWFAGVATAALLAMLVALFQFNSQIGFQTQRAAAAEKRLQELPLTPATRSRTVRVVPVARPPDDRMFGIGGGENAEFVTIELDFTRKDYAFVDMEIERADQGRVAVLRGLRRNSNGYVSWSLNSSALGPGYYVARLTGLDWRAQPTPAGFVSFSVTAPRR